ncbi:hypothetical protein [Spongorhabdus nitratireducens]
MAGVLRITQLAAYLVIIFSVLLFMLSLYMATDDLKTALFGFVLSALGYGSGDFLLKKIRSKIAEVESRELESYIFRYAITQNGVITAASLASEGKVSYKQSRELLDIMAADNICVKTTNASGNVSKYTFEELI